MPPLPQYPCILQSDSSLTSAPGEVGHHLAWASHPSLPSPPLLWVPDTVPSLPGPQVFAGALSSGWSTAPFPSASSFSLLPGLGCCIPSSGKPSLGQTPTPSPASSAPHFACLGTGWSASWGCILVKVLTEAVLVTQQGLHKYVLIK